MLLTLYLFIYLFIYLFEVIVIFIFVWSVICKPEAIEAASLHSSQEKHVRCHAPTPWR